MMLVVNLMLTYSALCCEWVAHRIGLCGSFRYSPLLQTLATFMTGLPAAQFLFWWSGDVPVDHNWLLVAWACATGCFALFITRFGYLSDKRNLAKAPRVTSVGDASAKPVDVAGMSIPSRNFSDIFGHEEIKRRLKEAAQVVVSAHRKGHESRNGILLHGEPGNGKTVFAEALAGELAIPFLRLTYADVASQWVGEKTSRVNAAFSQAMRHQPCILFIDEVDSFLAAREVSPAGGVKEDRDVVNALLTLMVDIRSSQVILVAATNYADRLDEAATREGRFDFKIEIGPPDAGARIGLLTHGIRKNLPLVSVEKSVIETVARRWNGFSVKRILAVTEELPYYLKREGKRNPEFDDFMGALRSLQGTRGYTPENVKPLSELILSDSSREMLDQIHGRLIDAEYTESLGGTLPTGILFYGPPGTGKTATAKALAKEIDYAFLPATGDELAKDVQCLDRLFEKAKQLRPCVIFIDEADELLRRRDQSISTESTNRLLTMLDGVKDRVKDVVWIAATNNPEWIDVALLRGGRFTEKVLFESPSPEQVASHLTQWFALRKVSLATDVLVGDIAVAFGLDSIANAEAVAQAALNRSISRRAGEPVVQRVDFHCAAKIVLAQW